MARSRLKKSPISLSDAFSVFPISNSEAMTGTELRISFLTSYILVLLTLIVLPPNLVIAIQTNNLFGLVFQIALAVFILAAPVTYYLTRSYTLFRGLLTTAMVLLIAGIVQMGGGPTGVGVFYIFVLTPFFYFILGWVAAALLPLVAMGLVALRFLIFGIDPASIFLVPRIGPAFGLAFGIGTLFVSGAVVTMRALTSGLSVTAYRDPVTGLPNKNKTMEVLEHRIKLAQLEKGTLGVIGLKLGHFSRAAATLDPKRADGILKTVTNRLLSIMPPGSFLSRYSGSVFSLITENKDNEQLKTLASAILAVVGPGGEWEEFPLVPTVVITCYPRDGETPERLFGNIMTTLQYRAYSESAPIFYDRAHYDREAERLKIGELLPGAVERGEFHLVYHPRLSVIEEQAVGAEVLLRWHNPILGEVSPSRFIPVAEELGIVREITRWVLLQAGKEGATIHRFFPERRLIQGVNLSSYDLASPGLFDQIEAGRTELDLPASAFEFEITERMLVDDNPMVATNLEELGRRGFRLAIDDFGTGYSNLRYLQRFHVNAVKIDRSFTQDITQDEGTRHIIKAILSLTTSLGMECVAEGVETIEQLEWLREAGCQYAQGYYFGEPFALNQYIAWLHER